MGRGGNEAVAGLVPSRSEAAAERDLGLLADSALEILLHRLDGSGSVPAFSLTTARPSQPRELTPEPKLVRTAAKLRAEAIDTGRPLIAVFEAHEQFLLFGFDPRSRSWTLSIVDVRPGPGSSLERISLDPLREPVMTELVEQVLEMDPR